MQNVMHSQVPAPTRRPRRGIRTVMVGLLAAAAMATATVSTPTPAEARGGRVAAGIIGGLAAGALFGGLVGPRYYYGPGYYYAPGPVYYGPGPVYYGPRCYWQRRRVWNGYHWRLRRVRVCY